MEIPQVEHLIVVKIATSSNPAELLELVINSHPEAVREQLTFAYGKALEEYHYSDSEVPVVITQDLGKYSQAEFVEKANPLELQLIKCPNDGHMHFRHAGYVMPAMPYVDKQQGKVAIDNVQVMLCIKCKHAYIARDGKLHDVTDLIDLSAWEKTEKIAHKETGPGGQC